MAGKFEVKSTAGGKVGFALKASNGRTILTGQSYKAKAAAENGVRSVRENASDDARFERKTAKDGRPYFVLKAGNGQVIGQSQMYASARSMEKGIASVKRHAAQASVEDVTE
jgi:uncharacterized protein YegP (UPF0339 family)